jgi:serine/threonine-protein kinase
LLIKGGQVKLADFGLSTAMTANQAPFTRMGTLEFAAQEIFLGQLSDRSDQYALAVSYCLLRGGRLPFADTPKRFISSYCRPQPDLSMLPPAERPAIHKALAASPVLRWPSCTTLMDHLRRAVEPAPRKAFA